MKDAIKLSPKQQHKVFNEFKKEGMFMVNVKKVKSGKPLMSQRKTKKRDILMCTSCKGFYSKSCFRRHRIHCSSDVSAVTGAEIVNFSENKEESFNQEILLNLEMIK